MSWIVALWPALAAAAEAPISEVVVYADRAQVTRTLAASCKQGEVRFEGLPSTLEVRSLWAHVDGGTVEGVTHTEEASGPRPAAKRLQDQVRQLDDQLVAIRDEVDVAQAKLSKLDSMKKHMRTIWGLQAAGKRADVGRWNAALDLLRKQAVAAHVTQRKARSRQRGLERQRQLLTAQLSDIERKRRRTTYTATVLLKCTGNRKVHLSYVVPAATWEMSYQLRASRSTGRATLVVQAAVHQGTGEDWDNVSLAVSTANLRRSNLPPKLRRMRVSTYEPRDTRKVLTRRLERRRHLKAAGKFRADKADEDSFEDQDGRGVPDSGIAFKLRAAKRVTVPGDGRRVMVELSRKAVGAKVLLETVPKLYPFVYTRVELDNPFPFTLLGGRVELFDGSTFLGRTRMKVRAPREPMAFTLGVNKQLQVKRYVKKEKVEGERGYGHDKKLRHRYVIQVGNWSNTTRTVRVRENVPVSQVRDIKIKMGDDCTKPTSWNKEDGILTWDVKLRRRSKKDLTLDYTVELPKSYVVRGY